MVRNHIEKINNSWTGFNLINYIVLISAKCIKLQEKFLDGYIYSSDAWQNLILIFSFTNFWLLLESGAAVV